VYLAGSCLIRNLENIGDSELLFTTGEFIDSGNAPPLNLLPDTE
jgi:hypothetical protein